MQIHQIDGDGFLPLNTEKDSEMNSSRELINPATIAALLLFAGSTSTAAAIADDRVAPDANEVSSAQVEETSKEQARLANEAAVEEAARAVKVNARIDLDIRLIGRTLVPIAVET